MSTTSPAIRNLARQLLAGEPARIETSNGEVDQAVRACEKLRGPLTKLAGAAGFSSLLSRALALARRQSPALEQLRVGADGALARFNEAQRDLGAAETQANGGVVLLTELLSLLVTLIGEPLTLSLVRQAWPGASIQVITLRTEEKP